MTRDAHQPIAEPAGSEVVAVDTLQGSQPDFLMEVLGQRPVTSDQVINKAEEIADVAIVDRGPGGPIAPRQPRRRRRSSFITSDPGSFGRVPSYHCPERRKSFAARRGKPPEEKMGHFSPTTTATRRKPFSGNRLDSIWVPLVVPDQWGTAAAHPALVEYDQWHPKSGGDERVVSKMAMSFWPYGVSYRRGGRADAGRGIQQLLGSTWNSTGITSGSSPGFSSARPCVGSSIRPTSYSLRS